MSYMESDEVVGKRVHTVREDIEAPLQP